MILISDDHIIILEPPSILKNICHENQLPTQHLQTKKIAYKFEEYLKSGSGRAFSKKRFFSNPIDLSNKLH